MEQVTGRKSRMNKWGTDDWKTDRDDRQENAVAGHADGFKNDMTVIYQEVAHQKL
jgi:hypothetical protein